MKKVITALLIFTILSAPVSAKVYHAKKINPMYENADTAQSASVVCESIEIIENNNSPIALNVFVFAENGKNAKGEMTANDSDGDKVVFEKMTEPKYGNVNFDRETGKFTYTPFETKTDEDFFEYRAYDGKSYSENARITILFIKKKVADTKSVYIDMWEHWAEDYAQRLSDDMVIRGEKIDGYYYFYPDTKMTKAAFCTIANSAFGFYGSYSDFALPFEDAAKLPAWMVLAASASSHGNMMHSTENGDNLLFDGNKNLTRIEAISMIYNVINPPCAENENIDYKDKNSLPKWSLDMVKSMKHIGLINGYDDNFIRPYDTVSKAETAKMLSMALSYMEDSDLNETRLK